MEYKIQNTYWLAKRRYYNESAPSGREVSYDAVPVKYVAPDHVEGRHWVTTLLQPTGAFLTSNDGWLLQSIADGHLEKVDGKDLFLTKDDVRRAEVFEQRFVKMEKNLRDKEDKPGVRRQTYGD